MSSLEQDFREHLKYTQRRFREMDEMFADIKAAQLENARQISELTTALNAQITQTAGVVEAFNNMRGAVKVGVAVQDFVIWLGKWGVVGAAIAGAVTWILKHAPPPAT